MACHHEESWPNEVGECVSCRLVSAASAVIQDYYYSANRGAKAYMVCIASGEKTRVTVSLER